MAVNKVVYDGNTLIDLTGDTVAPETLAAGATAHDRAGNPIVGAMQQLPPVTAANDGSIAQVSGGVWTAVPTVPAGRPEFKVCAIAFSDTDAVDIPEGCILGVY